MGLVAKGLNLSNQKYVFFKPCLPTGRHKDTKGHKESTKRNINLIRVSLSKAVFVFFVSLWLNILKTTT